MKKRADDSVVWEEETQGRTIHDRPPMVVHPTLLPILGALIAVIGLGSQDPEGDLTADRPLPIVC